MLSPSPEPKAERWTRQDRFILAGLFLLSLVVLALLAVQVPGPLDIDGVYYLLVARNLAQGRGLVVDAIWHYFQAAPEWPRPAGDLWMPLPALLMAFPMLLGETFRHAQAAQVLQTALLPLLAFALVRLEGGDRPWATLAGLLTLLAGTVTVHWLDSDSYTACALFGGAALYLMGLARTRPGYLVAAGLVGGLAALARNDGLLLLAVLWSSALLLTRREGRPFPWKGLLLGSALFLLPVALWVGRNLLLFGQPTPVSLAFFLTLRDYREMLAYRPQADWAGFWQQGGGELFSLRLQATGATLTVLAGTMQVWGLVPLLVTALRLRKRPTLWPAFLYLGLLFIAQVGAVPLLVLHGTWSRSLSAFLPAGYAAVALGVGDAVEGLLRRRPALPASLTRWTFLGLAALLVLVAGSSALALQLQSAQDHPLTWQQVGLWLQEHTTPDEVVMAQDPMAVLLYGERRAIGVPYQDPPLLFEIAASYGAEKVVLVESLASLLPPTLRALWEEGGSQGAFILLWEKDLNGERVRVYQIAASP